MTDDSPRLPDIVTSERSITVTDHPAVLYAADLNLSGVMSALSREPGNLQARLQNGRW